MTTSADVKIPIPESASIESDKSTWRRRLKSLFKPGGVGLVAIAFILAACIAVPINLANNSEVPPAVAQLTGIPGMLWLRALKATVLPLILASMILSMYRLRRIDGAGSMIAKYIMSYYICTTFVAVGTGFLACFAVLYHVITPVSPEDLEKLAAGSSDSDTSSGISRDDLPETTVADQVVGIFEQVVPVNIVGSIAQNQLLAVVTTGIVLGLIIPSNDSPIVKFMEEIETIIGIVIHYLILSAPVGVFFLLFSSLVILDMGDIMKLLGAIIGTSMAGMLTQWLIVYPLMFFLSTQRNPFPVFPAVIPATVTGLGTSSSAASLPASMASAEKLGIPTVITKFALPLGMTINMDGTGIYIPCVMLWMAAAQEVSLNFGQVATIGVLATLGAIGSSPVPNVGSTLTLLIADQVGIPSIGFFPLIMATDIVMDRFLTAVNVSGDLWGCLIATHWLEKKINLEDLAQATESTRETESRRESQSIIPKR